MGAITLCTECSSDITIISNRFIDEFMSEANDAQIKIYLYLLRCMGSNIPISVSDIADNFNYTEKDVLRALKYWDKKKVVSLSFNSNNSLSCIQLMDLNVKKIEEKPVVKEEASYDPGEFEAKDTVKVVDFSEKPNYTVEQLMEFKENPDISQVLFVTEAYLERSLRPGEITSIIFMYDEYGFSADLIEYLIEYCISNKKKNIKYIEAVAKTWADTGITTVEEAMARTSNAPKEVYQVFSAFGIRGRDPIEPEISYVYKWMHAYGFTMDIIFEACNRTIMKTHSASFEYADTILLNWSNEGVRTLEDIEKLDAKHSKKVYDKGSKAAGNKSNKGQDTKFNSFSQRKYDYDELERDALFN